MDWSIAIIVTYNVLCVDGVDLMSASLHLPDGIGRPPPNAHWQDRLEGAQNVLFCKELFSQVGFILSLICEHELQK